MLRQRCHITESGSSCLSLLRQTVIRPLSLVVPTDNDHDHAADDHDYAADDHHHDADNDHDDNDGGRVGVFFRSQLSCKAILAGWLFSAVFPILKINVSS